MTAPRWHRSQREVERALADGPKTVRAIIDRTGYSYNTIMACFDRAAITRSHTWPAEYALARSAFADVLGPEELSIAEPQLIHVVTPVEIPMENVGPKWQAGRAKIGQEIAEIDLESLSLKKAIEHLEIEAASLLGVIIQLRAVKDGPDWREQIGLAP